MCFDFFLWVVMDVGGAWAPLIKSKMWFWGLNWNNQFEVGWVEKRYLDLWLPEHCQVFCSPLYHTDQCNLETLYGGSQSPLANVRKIIGYKQPIHEVRDNKGVTHQLNWYRGLMLQYIIKKNYGYSNVILPLSLQWQREEEMATVYTVSYNP